MARQGKRSKRKSKGNQGNTRPGVPVEFPDTLPVLPSGDIVAFPSVMLSLYVGREESIEAINAAMKKDRLVLVLAQKTPGIDPSTTDDLNTIGVVANIVRVLTLSDGRHKILLQGLQRARVVSFAEKKGYLTATMKVLPSKMKREMKTEDEMIMNRIREHLQVLVEKEHLPEEMLLVAEDVTDPGVLADIILAHYKLDMQQSQRVLEELDPLVRLRITDTVISEDLNQYLVSETIRDRARDEMDKGQREYYLREQIKAIQRELGESDDSSEDLQSLKGQIETRGLPPQAHAEAMKQFKRLERMHPESSEYAMIRTYLDWMVELPWNVRTTDRVDLKGAKRILDTDHDGLEKAKERIIEYLSVRKLNPNTKGPILCFVGPPGVGKTSLGRSVAQALGRKFFRMSLGGVRDEAEIRGHRRTYVGALPGRIVQGMKQSGSRNPVFVLDELDKVGADFRGDPASALLEVLDPAQNKEFQDHYLNVEFDLSEVLFIATANTLDTIPDALLDRLEVIQIPGYTTIEKIRIAKRFLVPRQLKENGLSPTSVKFEETALDFLIDRYTREAGVRNLEREIGSLCRKLAREKAEGKRLRRKVTPVLVTELLGLTKFDPDADEGKDGVGLARGLAWTIHGGEMMPIEVSVAAGGGAVNLTGQLGSVMQESAQAAVFYARASAKILGLEEDFHQKVDIHLHVPAGATPKDGPSAGITIATALVSALSGRKVSKDVAMTGEMTLRGNVLAVGGLKEKALAALRYGIKKVIIPYDNIKDLEEIPKAQRGKITFIPVKHVSEVLEIALKGKTKRLPFFETKSTAEVTPVIEKPRGEVRRGR